MKKLTFSETVLVLCIIGSFLTYVTGTILIINTTMPWLLAAYAIFKARSAANNAPLDRYPAKIPWLILLWALCMYIIALATLVGLVTHGYDINQIIRSLLNWSRHWALFFLYPLIGASLNIRPQVLYRAACIICLQCLIIIPICYAAYYANIPPLIYSSPLERITQNGPVYYNILLYHGDEDGIRLALFTPWGPALGLLGNIYFFFALRERHIFWKSAGIVGSLAMIVTSASRSSLVFLPAVFLFLLVWCNFKDFAKPISLMLTGVGLFLSGLFASQILNSVQTLAANFKGARKSSSEVRDTLQRIALDRVSDAPIWGHGKLQPGFELVKNMPIGSHHTWIGLLFVHGIIGFLAFLVPFVITFFQLLYRSLIDDDAKVALSFFMTLACFTLADNQEVLAYLYWPGLVLVGYILRKDTVPIPKDVKPTTSAIASG